MTAALVVSGLGSDGAHGFVLRVREDKDDSEDGFFEIDKEVKPSSLHFKFNIITNEIGYLGAKYKIAP